MPGAGKLRILLGVLTAAVLALCLARDFRRPVELRIPTCGIRVDCRRTAAVDSRQLQDLIDAPKQAAWYGRYILDHASQEFHGLWNIAPGDTVILGGRQYRCGFITTGWSDCGIRGNGHSLPTADLYLCTCIPGGAAYQIYIVGISKFDG